MRNYFFIAAILLLIFILATDKKNVQNENEIGVDSINGTVYKATWNKTEEYILKYEGKKYLLRFPKIIDAAKEDEILSSGEVLIDTSGKKFLGFDPKRNPGEFDYGRFLSAKGINGILLVDKKDVVMIGQSRDLDVISSKAREHIKKAVRKYMDNDSATFLLVVMTGETNLLESDTKSAVAEAGF